MENISFYAIFLIISIVAFLFRFNSIIKHFLNLFSVITLIYILYFLLISTKYNFKFNYTNFLGLTQENISFSGIVLRFKHKYCYIFI